jgi:rhodanese-related sulfurtransferase
MALYSLTRIDAQTLKAWLACGDTILVDVREPVEYVREHIVGAQLMSLCSLDASQLPRDKRIVLCCASGNRSQTAARRLGLPGLAHLEGGLFAWKAYGFPTVKKPQPVRLASMRRFDSPVQAA